MRPLRADGQRSHPALLLLLAFFVAIVGLVVGESGLAYHVAGNNASVRSIKESQPPVRPTADEGTHASVMQVEPSSMALIVAAETEASGTALARQLGTSGEDLAGIDQGAKVRIPSLTNTAAYRIPDALTDTTLTEVKNVSYLSYTSQLQDFSYWATQAGRQFDLIVRANTILSGPLEDILNMTGSPINLIRGLPGL